MCEWVRGMAEKLELIRDCAELRMAKNKEGRMKFLNRGCKTREFVVGDLMLYRIPGMKCKLSDSWEGPYEVLQRVGEVNYKISRKGMPKHARIVHVNCLKKFKERFAVNRLDVVLEDSKEEECLLRGECEGYMQEEIDGLLEEFGEVFSDAPGSTEEVILSIDTGDALPIRQAPYSVPLGIRSIVVNYPGFFSLSRIPRVYLLAIGFPGILIELTYYRSNTRNRVPVVGASTLQQ